MSVLVVPGARLYYEIGGDGPPLIMVPGASGVVESFRLVAQYLAAHYSVVLYDRRGFSRSFLDGPQDYTDRLATDADDVRRLIAHLGSPATVVGASSGAIVASSLLTRHPEAVDTLVAFEPPAVLQLPDGLDWVDFFGEVYQLYRRDGVSAALQRFRQRTFPDIDQQAMAHARRSEADAIYWFEHELRQYPAVDLDIETLSTHAGRIVLANGRRGRGYPAYEVNLVLGRKLGREVVELPGGHVGAMTHSAEFAKELSAALRRNR